MNEFTIELANDPRPHSVVAAGWDCTRSYVLTALDDGGKIINEWQPNEWHRVVRRNALGHLVDLHVNPFVPRARR